MESWLEATGTLLGGDAYFPALESQGKISAQMVKSSPVGGSFQNYMLFLLSIAAANKSILITNSYFIPDDTMIEALLKAAARGVRVVVLVPGKIDHEITYRLVRVVWPGIPYRSLSYHRPSLQCKHQTGSKQYPSSENLYCESPLVNFVRCGAFGLFFIQ